MREPKIPGPHRSRICRVLQARNSRQAWSNHIKIQEKSGAGGGNRTILAYSFYVTYCKHTNARTAKPAVWPPPVYKIMYNEIGRCGTTFALYATLLLSPLLLCSPVP